MTELSLGLDIGTQGSKAVLVDDDGVIRARARADYDLIPDLADGHAEQHPDTWIQAIQRITAEVLSQIDSEDRVTAVGVSGQQHGFVPLDANHEVIRPAKLWCDTSTAKEAAELSATLNNPIPTGFTASKILWLKRHEPESWKALRHVLLPHDYVNFVLTGEKSMEPGDASGTGFFDVENMTFSDRAMEAIDPGLRGFLPALRQPGEWTGHLDARGAELLGLKKGTPVSTGGGDNMMSAIGSGATAPGVVVASLGTSGTVFCSTERPLLDPRGWIAPFCGSAGGWLPLLCVMNLTGVTEAVRTAFGMERKKDLLALTARAAEVPAGCDGLLWLPFLQGERVPDLPEARATMLGLRAEHLCAEVLFRAAIEGTSLNLGLGMEHMQGLGIKMSELRLVGGAAANPLWCQILADITGLPVRRLSELESGALGAALQAAWTLHRQEDPQLSIHGFTEPRIGLSPEVVEPGEDTGRYAELKQEFRRQLQLIYGVS